MTCTPQKILLKEAGIALSRRSIPRIACKRSSITDGQRYIQGQCKTARLCNQAQGQGEERTVG